MTISTPSQRARQELISWLSQDLLVASTDVLGVMLDDLIELSSVTDTNVFNVRVLDSTAA